MNEARILALAAELSVMGSSPSPNPPVGAVLVKKGRIISRGRHAAAGQPHAEVVALRRAKNMAKGATLFITLEPCSSHGRTPPCTAAILSAGVSRVVYAVKDPASQGDGILRKKGVQVKKLHCRHALRALSPWLHTQESRLPFVHLKCAVTPSFGFTPEPGKRWITARPARRACMHLRRQADAVLVSGSTLRVDDPRLTVRGLTTSSPPVPVILTRKLLPQTARVFSMHHRVFISAPPTVPLPQNATRLAAGSLTAALAALKARGLLQVFAEAGPRLSRLLLTQKKVQRFSLFVAGGARAPRHFLQCPLPRPAFTYHYGVDTAFEFDLQKW